MTNFDGSKCIKCGRCCMNKVWIVELQKAIASKSVCPNFDHDTKLCKVYDRRFEVADNCTTVEDMGADGGLPQDCPCVGGVHGYVSEVIYGDEQSHSNATEQGERNK